MICPLSMHEEPSWGTVSDIEPLPASRQPTALPIEIRCTITELCRKQNYAAPSELRSTLHSYAATLLSYTV
jgi:hypothetical protein